MITPVSESAFTTSRPADRLIEHDHARRFGSFLASLAAHPLLISWRSDGIDPAVEVDERGGVAWIGVDQRIACVTLEGRTLFSIGLASSVLMVKPYPQFTAILCETQLIIINHDYSIRQISDLPDAPDAVEFSGGRLVINFLDGTSSVVSP